MFTFIGGFALAALAFLLAQLGYVKAIYDNFYAERVLPEPGVDNEEEISKKLADARVELDSTMYAHFLFLDMSHPDACQA